MKTNKKAIIISGVIAIIGLILILGGAYALFNYYRKGTTENSVTTGKITFRYDETSVNGIDLPKALPILDKEGEKLSEEGEYFDFTVSTKGTDTNIYYNIEVETTDDSTLDPNVIKVYLTKLENDKEVIQSISINNGKIVTYGDLPYNEDKTAKQLGGGIFNQTDNEQEHKYRLRIWIAKDADFSPLKNEDGTYQEDENGNYIYPYNNQTFKVRVNVKATTIFDPQGYVGDLSGTCTEEFCSAGGNILTLPDNSKWSLLTDYRNGDETINLIYTDLIDLEGNYTQSDNLYPYSENNMSTVNTYTNQALTNFLSKIKSTLQDDNVTVSLPTTELLNFDFIDYSTDHYYLDNLNPFFYYSNNYIVQANSYTYWTINNRVLKRDYEVENYGIKPVITVSKDYLQPLFAS